MTPLSPPRLRFCCSSSIPANAGSGGGGGGGERGDAEALCLPPSEPNEEARGEDNEHIEPIREALRQAPTEPRLPPLLRVCPRRPSHSRHDGVLLLAGCCDPFNEKALRAARGAFFQLPLVSGNRSHLNSLRFRFQLKMLAGHPRNWSKVGSKGPSVLSREFADSLSGILLCLVLGSEGNGLSMQTMQSC